MIPSSEFSDPDHHIEGHLIQHCESAMIRPGLLIFDRVELSGGGSCAFCAFCARAFEIFSICVSAFEILAICVRAFEIFSICARAQIHICVEAIELGFADYVQALARPNFSAAWQALEVRCSMDTLLAYLTEGC